MSDDYEFLGWLIPVGEESSEVAMIDTEPYFGDERDRKVFALRAAVERPPLTVETRQP